MLCLLQNDQKVIALLIQISFGSSELWDTENVFLLKQSFGNGNPLLYVDYHPFNTWVEIKSMWTAPCRLLPWGGRGCLQRPGLCVWNSCWLTWQPGWHPESHGASLSESKTQQKVSFIHLLFSTNLHSSIRNEFNDTPAHAWGARKLFFSSSLTSCWVFEYLRIPFSKRKYLWKGRITVK